MIFINNQPSVDCLSSLLPLGNKSRNIAKNAPILGAKSLNANCCYTKNKVALNNYNCNIFLIWGKKPGFFAPTSKTFQCATIFSTQFSRRRAVPGFPTIKGQMFYTSFCVKKRFFHRGPKKFNLCLNSNSLREKRKDGKGKTQ